MFYFFIDCFVNSQEWTLSRSTPDLRIGIVGCPNSGKSALVHRYLTGSYVQDESPEGGRFKKEINLDGQSYLLLIRDEGGLPEVQFASWIDAVIIVFSLTSEASFNSIASYYNRLSQYPNALDVPIVLVGTQESLHQTNGKIDSKKIEKYSSELHPNCVYIETCSTIGFNVDHVFMETCSRIIRSKSYKSRSLVTPINSPPGHLFSPTAINNSSGFTGRQSMTSPISGSFKVASALEKVRVAAAAAANVSTAGAAAGATSTASPTNTSATGASTAVSDGCVSSKENKQQQQQSPYSMSASGVQVKPSQNQSNLSSVPNKFAVPHPASHRLISSTSSFRNSSKSKSDLTSASLTPLSSTFTSTPKTTEQLPTPSSTPSTKRKEKRRSNIFPNFQISKSKTNGGGYFNQSFTSTTNGPADGNTSISDPTTAVGSGRAIPIRQGYLYKKSLKSLNKDWKKKYVTLTSDGKLTYHPTLHDYMSNVHGKQIPLQHTTVKIKPKFAELTISSVTGASSSGNTCPGASSNPSASGASSSSAANSHPSSSTSVTNTSVSCGTSSGIESSNESATSHVNGTRDKKDKKHRRTRSNIGRDDDSDCEFRIVSLENKEWRFDAESASERAAWVSAINDQILSSLQCLRSDKVISGTTSSQALADKNAINAIKSVPGNDQCADCGAANPVWAAINLGTLVCIECSGIHRNLGTHISKVRSIDLDDWPVSHVQVMMSLGNQLVNSLYEGAFNADRGSSKLNKPKATSSHEEKEKWIRAKYEAKEFLLPLKLSPLSSPSSIFSSPTSTAKVTNELKHQLIESIRRSDVQSVLHILSNKVIASSVLLSSASSSKATASSPNSTAKSSFYPLHLAASLGNLAICQLLIWVSQSSRYTLVSSPDRCSP